ncbi:uncharacterized protein [Miscanthus floridulus]|uniref:uncharacterized protein n=1 Tax=Miscanthus floridulus TaxID=154761 RepID=UPI003458138C
MARWAWWGARRSAVGHGEEHYGAWWEATGPDPKGRGGAAAGSGEIREEGREAAAPDLVRGERGGGREGEGGGGLIRGVRGGNGEGEGGADHRGREGDVGEGEGGREAAGKEREGPAGSREREGAAGKEREGLATREERATPGKERERGRPPVGRREERGGIRGGSELGLEGGEGGNGWELGRDWGGTSFSRFGIWKRRV